MNIQFSNKKIGIIGGGQLGKMMILEAKKLGLYVTVLDPYINCPASSICDELILAPFNDKDALSKLASCSDVITYEFEHIDYISLIDLQKEGHTIYPDPNSLKIIQNKYTQKLMLKEHNIPMPRFSKISNEGDIKNIAKAFSYPIILKACTGGYDGKGNFVIKSEKDIQKSINLLNPSNDIPLMIEEFVDFSMEISVLACRDIYGNIKIYPVCKNIHIDSILHKTIVPADIANSVKEKALKVCYDIISIFKGVGIFCIELFVTKEGDVLLNEVAPRPHNSGHYTIEGCTTSQFENHIRAICSLPLGSTSLVSPSVMINLLGEKNYTGKALVDGLKDALSYDGVSVHIYGKTHTKPNRKMGHLTCVSSSIENAIKIADKSFEKIKIISE